MQNTMLIGRQFEQVQLKEALESKQAELIAVIGRRRIGKTHLIREVYRDEQIFELTGLHNGSLSEQLQNFHQVLTAYGESQSLPKNWLEAFDQLSQYISSKTKKKKRVVFLDEFPWLDGRKSGFMTAFEAFWNGYASKNTQLVVVICGSAAAYMVQKIVRNKGGLHNRLTRKLRLLPFNLAESREFLQSKGIRFTAYDVARIYLCLGGIPHYLNMLNRGESVPQAIDRICFSADGMLNKEFNDVFASLFASPERHESVVRALAGKRKGMDRNQIAESTGISSGGRLSKTLDELLESGFIAMQPTGIYKSRDSIYRLLDEFCLFHLKFIEGRHNEVNWQLQSASQSFRSWAGYSFESLCLKHLRQIKKALGIESVQTASYTFQESDDENGAQIDLVIDRKDNVINLCEMKFYDAEYTINKAYASNLRNKRRVFLNSTKTRKNVQLVMLTTYGVRQNSYSLELLDSEITIEQLFD